VELKMNVIGEMTLGLKPGSVESFDAVTGIARAYDPARSQIVNAKFKGFKVFFIQFEERDQEPIVVEWSCTQRDESGVRRGVIIVPDLEFIEVVDVSN